MPRPPAPGKMPELSQAEKELLVWYADGVTIREMAQWRRCGVATINRALADVRKTLAVDGLTVHRLLGEPCKKIRMLSPKIAKAL